jgi:hypothetical protein
MQKTLDKGRTHVLDYLKLIQDLVHFLEVIHNIWMSTEALFYFRKAVQKQLFELQSSKTAGAHTHWTRRP